MKTHKKKKSDIPTKKINSWDKLEEILNTKKYRKWIFRGQSDASWDLISGYLRYARNIKTITTPDQKRLGPMNMHEKNMFKKFQAHAHLYLTNLPPKTDTIEWLALMQHHGTPTRMLDWSFSPYVALFFAVESADKQFSLYCMKPDEFRSADEDYFGKLGEDLDTLKKKVFIDKRGNKNFLYAYEPKFQHERLVSQQALFTISSSNYESYEQILSNYTLDESAIIKLNFQPSLIPEIMKKLSIMNINAATLFPGLDGFCRSLKHQLFYSPRCFNRIC